MNAEEAEKARIEEEKKNNVFYMNLDDFALYKLKSAVFLIMFPLSFSIAIINLWVRIIPFTKKDMEEMNK